MWRRAWWASALLGSAPARAARLFLNTFEERHGGQIEQVYDGPLGPLGSVDVTFADSPGSPSAARAMRLAYTVVQAETWGGFVKVDFGLRPDLGVFDCRSSDVFSIWYNTEQPQSNRGRAHIRLIFEDWSSGGEAEHYYSFNDWLDDGVAGWKQVVLTPEKFSFTGWAGKEVDRVFDLDALSYQLEVSIDDKGDLRSNSTGVIWIDSLSCESAHAGDARSGLALGNALDHADRTGAGVWLAAYGWAAATDPPVAGSSADVDFDAGGGVVIHGNYSAEAVGGTLTVYATATVAEGGFYDLANNAWAEVQVSVASPYDIFGLSGEAVIVGLALLDSVGNVVYSAEGAVVEVDADEDGLHYYEHPGPLRVDLNPLRADLDGVRAIMSIRLSATLPAGIAAEASCAALFSNLTTGPTTFTAGDVSSSETCTAVSSSVFSHYETETKFTYHSFGAKSCCEICTEDPECNFYLTDFTHCYTSSRLYGLRLKDATIDSRLEGFYVLRSAAANASVCALCDCGDKVVDCSNRGLETVPPWGDGRTAAGFYAPRVLDLAGNQDLHLLAIDMFAGWPKMDRVNLEGTSVAVIETAAINDTAQFTLIDVPAAQVLNVAALHSTDPDELAYGNACCTPAARLDAASSASSRRGRPATTRRT